MDLVAPNPNLVTNSPDRVRASPKTSKEDLSEAYFAICRAVERTLYGLVPHQWHEDVSYDAVKSILARWDGVSDGMNLEWLENQLATMLLDFDVSDEDARSEAARTMTSLRRDAELV